MLSTTSLLHIDALPPDELARIRDQGTDDFGNPLVTTVVDKVGGTPLRCCLRDARVGERVTLLAYQPTAAGGPYAEVGPIFIHAAACPGYTASDRYPDDFRGRRQLLRAYGHDGGIVNAVIVEEGAEGEKVCAAYLSRSDVAFIHSRNVLWGCYMFTIRRPA